MSLPQAITVSNIDHLGLVAGMIDEIGIVAHINDLVGCQTGEKVSPGHIKITYGYSRDHRPDLKQFILDLICSEDGDVPLFLRIGDGNESDQAVFPQVFCEFKKQLDLDALMVADSALYSESNLKQMASLKWLTRVPLTIKQAKDLVSQREAEAFTESTIAGYRWSPHQSLYGIEQVSNLTDERLRILHFFPAACQGYYLIK